MENLFKSIGNIGLSRRINPALERKIVLTNQVSFITGIFLAPYPFLFLKIGHIPLVIMGSIFAIIQFTFILLNYFGFYKFSRISYILVTNLTILTYGVYLGMKTEVHLFFLVLATLSFFIFDLKEKVLFVMALTIPVLFFIFTLWHSFYIWPITPLSEDMTLFINNASSILVLFFFVIVTSAFYMINLQYQNKIMASEQSKRELVRILSHDINNPLSVIDYSLKKYNESSLSDDKLRKIMVKAKRASENIIEMITDVREMEALESGKKELNLVKVPICDLIKDVASFFEFKLEKKNINLKLEMKVESDASVLADGPSLKNQVLNNILSNAIKFSNKESNIYIEVSNCDKEICIKIKDEGIGIPKNILSVLFDPYSKTTRVGTEGELGTGFGMPLVKSFMEDMGGKVIVKSHTLEQYPKDHGTIFELYLRKA